MVATGMKLTVQYPFKGDNYTVDVFYDDEANVWCAIAVNFVGIALEDETLERLIARLELAIPEMVELNYG